jgi:outer membrane murein-binding lipoprotein Lpp
VRHVSSAGYEESVSPPPDPDEPTRRLPPTHPPDAPLPPRYEREVAVTAGDDLVWREEVLDRLDSLRTAVVLLGLVAVAALGVALWALLTQEEEGDARRGASVEQVRDLEERVDELEQDVEQASPREEVSQLSDSVESLDERIGALEDRVERQADGGASEQAVEDLQGDVQEVGDAVEQLGDAVEQLDQRVAAVEQQQEASP